MGQSIVKPGSSSSGALIIRSSSNTSSSLNQGGDQEVQHHQEQQREQQREQQSPDWEEVQVGEFEGRGDSSSSSPDPPPATPPLNLTSGGFLEIPSSRSLPLLGLGSVQDQVFRNTRRIQQLASITYAEFLSSVRQLNEISSHFLDENGKQLIFAVKKGTDTTLFWKATVKVACVKVDTASKNIDSYKPLNLKQFLQVFNSLQNQAAAVKDRKEVFHSIINNIAPPPSNIEQEIVAVGAEGGGASTTNKEEEEIDPNSLEECCICLERKPEVILPCAHSYCLPCIEQWNVDHKTCPVCREIVTTTEDSWVISDIPDSVEIVTEIQKSLMELAQ